MQEQVIPAALVRPGVVTGGDLPAAWKHPALLSFEGTMVSQKDEEEDSKPVWSSMDSSTWATHCMRGAPMPPDRRVHERHLVVLDQFRRHVEGASREFAEILESCR
ncbi:unnamed protein product [Symbiodinium natans]|uniref:Uncharacterized protein n=1 Tax=Symbiodinium natans TaxID=878477 RepID=A0A812LQ62_9DINO|nr:unnamed protein product [Symbiodinium natans]